VSPDAGGPYGSARDIDVRCCACVPEELIKLLGEAARAGQPAVLPVKR
jgi:hypothetical protein